MLDMLLTALGTQIYCHWECQVCMCSRQRNKELWIARHFLFQSKRR